MTVRSYRLWLLALYALGVAMIAAPVLAFLWSSEYIGLLPIRSPDEGHYLVRMQAHLLYPFVAVRDGVWFTPTAPAWLQVSLIEYVLGSLLSWTALTGLQVGWLSMIFFAPLSILFVSQLARKSGASDSWSLVAGFAFFILMHSFRRMFHPSISFPLTALGFLLMWQWWQDPRRWTAFFAGAVAGSLIGVYLWSWTFLWAAWAPLVVYACIAPSPVRKRRFKSLPFLALGTLLFASPGVFSSLAASASPYFTESADRMGLLLSHELESPFRSALMVILAVAAFVACRTREQRERFAPLLASVLALVVVYNQQIIHGRIMSFSSHYYTFVCLVAFLLLVWAVVHRSLGVRVWAVGLVACIPLVAAAHDYRFWSDVIGGVEKDGTTHLGEAMKELDKLPQGTVLTDGFTGNVVGASTKQGVAFIEYSRILLITTQEYADRYCLSEAVGSGKVDTRWFADFQEERSKAALAHTKELYAKHLAMAETTCPLVEKNLTEYLKKYHVTAVLWNQVRRPEWKLDPKLFELVKKGEGWSVWEVKNEK